MLAMRIRLEESADPGNIKRGRGGIMDIEFIAQYLQLVHGPAQPKLRLANTIQALKALMKAKKLTEEDGKQLCDTYLFLRMLENRLRIVHGLSSNSLPKSPEALRRLALRTGYADDGLVTAQQRLLELYRQHTTLTREILLKIGQSGVMDHGVVQ